MTSMAATPRATVLTAHRLRSPVTLRQAMWRAVMARPDHRVVLSRMSRSIRWCLLPPGLPCRGTWYIRTGVVWANVCNASRSGLRCEQHSSCQRERDADQLSFAGPLVKEEDA